VAVMKIVRGLLLVGLGLYFAYLLVSGNLKNYINTEVAWLTTTAVVFFLALGLGSLYSAAFAPREHGHEHAYHDHDDDHDHAHDHDHADGHVHARISWGIVAVAAIPLLLGVLIPSQPLGASMLDENLGAGVALDTSGSTSTVTQSPATDPGPGTSAAVAPSFPVGDDSDVTQWNIYDWSIAFRSTEKERSWFNGQPADVVGILVRPESAPAGHFVAGRWVMRHCAADAYGVGMLVRWAGNEKFPVETWVRAKGTIEVRQVGGGSEPTLVLSATSVEEVPEPDVPYLFPRRVNTR
jgi:putative membrane protein